MRPDSGAPGAPGSGSVGPMGPPGTQGEQGPAGIPGMPGGYGAPGESASVEANLACRQVHTTEAPGFASHAAFPALT